MKDLIAALSFFTRLPFWRLCEVPADSYRRLVAWWPVAGWLTGGLLAVTFVAATSLFGPMIAVPMAFAARMLLTGALHEDGLADFFDGMGGGRTREQVLRIMKDSAIGSFGVLALVIYAAIWMAAVYTLTDRPFNTAIVLIAADVWSKWCASQLINLLPYARTDAEAKNRLVYHRSGVGAFVGGLLAALPALVLLALVHPAGWIGMAVPATAAAIGMALLSAYMWHRLKGYTGDCCGALFLLCELSFLVVCNAV